MRASSPASPSATTPTGQSRTRALFERKTPEERSAKRAAIAAAHPINPVVQLDKYGPTLYLHGMSYEDKSVLHKSYVNEHGHIMKDEPYVTYQGSKNDGQNNYPHYPLSACKIDGYVPKMPVTCLQHALDTVEVCKKKWPSCVFKPLEDKVRLGMRGQRAMRCSWRLTRTINPLL